MDGGENGFSEYGYQIYTDIDLLKTQLKKIYRKNPIPGQPTNKKGKPYNYFVYNMVYVNVDDMEHVTEVQKAITDMGYEAYSSMQWLEQAQQQTDMIQAVLGGKMCIRDRNMGGGTYKSNLPDNLEIIKEVGYKNVMVDTDGGQTENPHWELAIEEYMQYLLDHEISEEQVYHMTHTIPAGLLGI